MITINVVFFASFKEYLDCSSLELEVSDKATIAIVCSSISQKGGRWHDLFSKPQNKVKVAVNKTMADMMTNVSQGDEVAFFPPVTGG